MKTVVQGADSAGWGFRLALDESNAFYVESFHKNGTTLASPTSVVRPGSTLHNVLSVLMRERDEARMTMSALGLDGAAPSGIWRLLGTLDQFLMEHPESIESEEIRAWLEGIFYECERLAEAVEQKAA